MILLMVLIGRWYVRKNKRANELWKKEIELLKKQQFGGLKVLWLVVIGKGMAMYN